MKKRDFILSTVTALLLAILLVGCSAPLAENIGFEDLESGKGWTRASFSRTLRQGMTGSDVKELQIRIAGWAADGASQSYVAADGNFGAGTKAALIRFQRAYGLTADGIAGAKTFAQLNSLESSDGSTRNFSFSEFMSKDGSGFSGGKVSSAQVKENVRRTMWKLEALRRKAGNRSVTINSAFRSISHNSSIGGATNSQHMYGIAADITVSGLTPYQVRDLAKACGFSGIKRYSSFTHVDSRVEYPAYGSATWWWVN